MKAENKQLNRYCNNKDTTIQALKVNTAKIISTSLDENNNRIKSMSDLHRAGIVMKDQTISEQAKELQEQKKISNIVILFYFNLYFY